MTSDPYKNISERMARHKQWIVAEKNAREIFLRTERQTEFRIDRQVHKYTVYSIPPSSERGYNNFKVSWNCLMVKGLKTVCLDRMESMWSNDPFHYIMYHVFNSCFMFNFFYFSMLDMQHVKILCNYGYALTTFCFVYVFQHNTKKCRKSNGLIQNESLNRKFDWRSASFCTGAR